MAPYWGSFLRFLLILLFEKSQSPHGSNFTKLVAFVFIKLDFARNMDAAASNVEEMALEEMS